MFHVCTTHDTLLVFDGVSLSQSDKLADAVSSEPFLNEMLNAGFYRQIEVIDLGDGRFALRHGSLYACAAPQQERILFDRKCIGPWETFFCTGLAPDNMKGRKFYNIPFHESQDYKIFYRGPFHENFPIPEGESPEDLDWYQNNTSGFFPIKSGPYESETLIALGKNKVLTTRFKAHGSLLDRSGFLNNFGFIYREREGFDRLSVDPTDSSIRVDIDDVTSNSYLKGDYLLAFDGNSFNYYHFVIDGLVHLMEMRALGLSSRAILCVQQKMSDWQQEYLDIIGESSVILIDSSKVDLVQLEKVFYMKSIGLPHMSKKSIKRLADRVKHSLAGRLTPTSPRRLYIERRQGQRSVTNQKALESFLKERDFESVDLESLSVAAQVNLFYNADVIVGPHGAGLVNIIYCKAGALLIDLIPGVGEVRNFFWLLAAKVDVRYTFVRCEAENGFGGSLTVDLSKLADTLNARGVD